MANQNKKKLLIGLILIIVAFGCLIGTLFCSTPKDPANSNDKMVSLEAQVALLKEQLKNRSHSSAVKNEPVLSLKLETLVKKAEGIYPETERTRKEGFLWFDRVSQNFVITLGALNGLHIGSQLAIYDADKRIDTASVDFPFDVVSYVRPQKNSPESFSNNYYRVVVEGQ